MNIISDIILYKDEKIIVDELNNRIIFEKSNKIIESDFFYPRGIDIFQDKIYITDSYHNRVKIFDINGNYIADFGEKILKEPYGIKIYQEKIFISNKDVGKISVFDIEFNYLYDIGSFKYNCFFDIYRDNIYVSNTNENKIQIYDIDGNLKKVIENSFKYPCGIKIFEDKIFIADQFNKRVVCMDIEGKSSAEILQGGYYSIFYVENDILFAYEEKGNEFLKIDTSSIKLLECDTENRSNNLKIIKFESEDTIDKISENLKIQKPKALFVKDDNLWFCMHNHRAIVCYDLKEKIFLNIFQTGVQAEKIIVTDSKIIVLDYFFRDIMIADKKTLKNEGKIENKDFVRIADMILYKNRIYILDSAVNKVFIFNIFGKFIKSCAIKGEDNVSLKVFNEKIYVLDKRVKTIYCYDMFFNYKYEKKLEETSYPEDMEFDNEGNIYICDDSISKIIKYDKDFYFKGEIEGFFTPTEILKYENQFLIADFALGKIKLCKIG